MLGLEDFAFPPVIPLIQRPTKELFHQKIVPQVALIFKRWIIFAPICQKLSHELYLLSASLCRWSLCNSFETRALSSFLSTYLIVKDNRLKKKNRIKQSVISF